MFFQLVVTKFFKSELFSCLRKIDHMIKSCKEPIETGQFLIDSVAELLIHVPNLTYLRALIVL